MTLPQLVPRVIYGHRTDVKNNAHYITDSEIMYASGNAVIFQNIKQNTQKYLILPEKARYLSRLLLSPKRTYMAALVILENQSLIHIIEVETFKRKRTLYLPKEATTTMIVSLCFSHDERLVVVITGHPDWMMLVYDWERGKVESCTKANLLTNPLAPVKEVVCSPADTTILLMYGEGLFRLMNLQESVWRQYGFQKGEIYDITAACFLTEDRILLGTNDGLLLLIELAELKYIFEAEEVTFFNAKGDKEEEALGAITSTMVLERAKAIEEEEVKRERAVRALIPLTNGFAFACGSQVHFFEKLALHKYKKRNVYEITDENFQENQTINLNTITHLAVNCSETKMMATTRKSQLYEVKLWGPEMEFAGNVPFVHLWWSLHTNSIGDLALCLWKPIFMTCGKFDRTVRVWNYLKNSLELVKQYEEDIHSVSLHPTGFYAAIGFPDKLRLMIISIEDLQVTKELPIRDCPKSEFNAAGHLLAAVNRNIIQLFNIITFQLLANFEGHNAPIKCLQWTQDSKKLISCGEDGAVYEWDVNTFKRVGEVVHKGVCYWECAVTSNGKTIYAVGTDNLLKEFHASSVVRSLNFNKKNMTHVVLSRSDMMMFIASSEGWLMPIKMPLEDPPEFEINHAHAWGIRQMKISMDDRYLISCSDTGTICVWNLENIKGKTVVMGKDFDYFKEVLISKADFDEKLSSIKDLTQRTHELETEHALRMRNTTMNYEEKIEYIKATYEQALEELKETLETLETNHNTELNDISNDFNIIKEKHKMEMLEVETKFHEELIVEYDKVKNLEEMNTKLIQEYGKKLDDLKESKTKTIAELTRINESKLHNYNKMVEEAREEINKEIAEHNELTSQIEDDNDKEIESLKSQNFKTLKAARESNIRLKEESGVLKKKIISCEKEKDHLQIKIDELMNDLEKYKKSVQSMEQKIQNLKKKVRERDLKIQEKEERIYDLNKKNQEYERYKFRIKELKNQIEPMDKEIKEKREQMSKMEAELYKLQKVNLTLDNNLSLLRQKLGNSYKILCTNKSKCNVVMQVIKKVKSDIYAASAHTQDYKKLKDGVKKLYFKYITNKYYAKAQKGEEECTYELKRQKAYLEDIVRSLYNQIEMTKQVRYGEGMIYMEMNWSLMDEINKIRKKLKTAQSKIQEMVTIFTISISKIYSKQKAHKVLFSALKGVDELKEEYEIKIEEVTTVTALMRDEIDFLHKRINILETALAESGVTTKKKKRMEPLFFDI